MVARFLITTADETTWRTEGPVLFLGDWCRLHARRDVWSGLDAQIVPYHWDDRDKLYSDYCNLGEISERILPELAARLNALHRVDHSVRYWRLLVGPWLVQFTQMLFDRWEMIQRAVEHHDISGTRVFDASISEFVPNDMADFSRLFVGDQWNQAIYGYLLEHGTGVRFERVAWDSTRVGNGTLTHARGSGVRNVRRFIGGIAARLREVAVRPREAFFISVSLPARDSFALQWQFGQLPRSWRSVETPVSAVRLDRRQWRLSGHCNTDFERTLRDLIPLQIPAAYLEGYGDLMEKVSALRWPQRPRFIFTDNAQHSDEVFKAWAAQKVDGGTPLVIGQHGGGYGISKFISNEEHEIRISDRYLTWGWTSRLCAKVVGTCCVTIGSHTRGAWDPQGLILVVTASYPRFSYKLTSEPIASQWREYFEGQCRFSGALPESVRKQLLIRLYREDYGWSQKERWGERFPHVRLDDGTSPIASLIRKCRLYVSTYNATTFLQSLAMNIPTIMFWSPRHWELRDDAIPYFERLKAVGIFHETPESAAAKVAEIYSDVPGWWKQPEIQQARRFFCDRLSRTVDRPVQVLKEALTSAMSSGARVDG